VPLVIRMATGAGKQLAAQHSHSLEGWYAHIPGLKVLAPATVEDARGMLWTALQDPDPVLIFENVMLYNRTGRSTPTRARRHHQGRVRREGTDVSLITYGGSLFKVLEAAEALARRGDQRRGHRPAHACARSMTRRSWPRSARRAGR
jgi:2-oxoisovalerate dehydrogenase E1 component